MRDGLRGRRKGIRVGGGALSRTRVLSSRCTLHTGTSRHLRSPHAGSCWHASPGSHAALPGTSHRRTSRAAQHSCIHRKASWRALCLVFVHTRTRVFGVVIFIVVAIIVVITIIVVQRLCAQVSLCQRVCRGHRSARVAKQQARLRRVWVCARMCALIESRIGS